MSILRPIILRYAASARGFTMIEMAIVLTIMAILMTGVLKLSSASQEANRRERTAKNLDMIETALIAYKKENSRLPCPAPVDELLATATFGVELATCDSATDSGVTDTGSVDIGVVPTRTLNIPDSYMFDGWGRRFTYAVTEALINSTNYSGGSGAITVEDGGSNTILSDSAYIVISHGKDRKGSRDRDGVNSLACGTTELDKENCDGDATFTDAFLNDHTTGATYFYDLVRWKHKTVIDSEAAE